MTDYFQPHGRFTLARKGRFIRVQVCGNLNDRLIVEIFRQVRSMRSQLPRYWGLLILPLGENTIGTPDAKQQVIYEMMDAYQQGCAVMCVCPHSDIQAFRFREFDQNLPMPVEVFDTVEQAETWIEAELEKLNV